VNPRATHPARVLLVDKPTDWTSYDVIRHFKKAGVKDRIGHAGTLDPFATGLLLVMTGQATRISSLLMDLPKEYVFTVQLGAVSSTGDPTGEIRPVEGLEVDGAAVLKALDEFRGVIRQRVPMTSAVKVGGEALYRKAHRGEVVETPEREVVVYDLSLVSFDESSRRAELCALTGKGTYVRQLVDDLGERLGVGAYTVRLRRTRIGRLSVADARPPADMDLSAPEVSPPAVLSVATALEYLPRHDVAGREAERAANGSELSNTPAGRFRVYGPAGLLGVWEGVVGSSRPVVVFARPED
jgi:tRNA pseudouridine55 synthase